MKKEKWADIKGFEGWYQVSTEGRARSVDRMLHVLKEYIIICNFHICKYRL